MPCLVELCNLELPEFGKSNRNFGICCKNDLILICRRKNVLIAKCETYMD